MILQKRGLWQPSEKDKFDKKTLQNALKFFESDLDSSIKDLKIAQNFVAKNLTKSKKSSIDLIAERKLAVEVSRKNLELVKKLIQMSK